MAGVGGWGAQDWSWEMLAFQGHSLISTGRKFEMAASGS